MAYNDAQVADRHGRPQCTAVRQMSGDTLSDGGALRHAARLLLCDPALVRRTGVDLRVAARVIEVVVVAGEIARRAPAVGDPDEPPVVGAYDVALVCIAEGCGIRRASERLTDPRSGAREAATVLLARLLEVARAVDDAVAAPALAAIRSSAGA